MIYLDSNAVVKLVREEAETPQLTAWISTQPDGVFVSSTLIEVEVPRALWRNQPEALAGVASRLRQISRIEIDEAVRATAAAYVDPNLRALDAIHLATADNLKAAGKHITAFVTYDKRLAAAAKKLRLHVVAPGFEPARA